MELSYNYFNENNRYFNTRFEQSLKKLFRVSAACWHAFVAARPSADFFTSKGLAAKSSAQDFNNPYLSVYIEFQLLYNNL